MRHLGATLRVTMPRLNQSDADSFAHAGLKSIHEHPLDQRRAQTVSQYRCLDYCRYAVNGADRSCGDGAPVEGATAGAPAGSPSHWDVWC
jgi:hypothetical protein